MRSLHVTLFQFLNLFVIQGPHFASIEERREDHCIILLVSLTGICCASQAFCYRTSPLPGLLCWFECQFHCSENCFRKWYYLDIWRYQYLQAEREFLVQRSWCLIQVGKALQSCRKWLSSQITLKTWRTDRVSAVVQIHHGSWAYKCQQRKPLFLEEILKHVCFENGKPTMND